MTKRIFALMLALLALCALVACSPDEGTTGDPVINIGVQKPTYKDSYGDTFTYDYLSSTTVAITGFSGSDEPHTVTIPAMIEDREVVAIADEAFYANSNISAVKCEAKLTAVGNYAFAYCEALKTVELPSTLQIVGTGAFYNCSALISCTLPEGVTTINDNAFANCGVLPSITLPSTLKTIGKYAFANCVALEAIVIPEGATTVGDQAFYNCTAVAALNLPASLTEIGEWAFNPIVRELPDEAITVVADSVAAKYVKQFRP